jgi:ABC-type dipeptide/oligopeptide/nickel transport system permease component
MFRFTRSLALLALVVFVFLQPTLAFAQDSWFHNDEEIIAFVVTFWLAISGTIVAVYIAISIGIVVLINGPLKKIPSVDRVIEPGQVWLLCIPCFSLFWNFMVFQKVPQSFQRHFKSQGRTDLKDCGEQLGLWYAITKTLSGVPCLNFIAQPAGLILLILFLAKIHSLKGQIN